jgi:glycerol uptake facilitator-like aquaporin
VTGCSTLTRRAAAEAIGTALLLAAIVGSGIMAERLSGGNVALALLANTIATGASLVVLILTFGPISGAHFNPVVSLTEAWRGALPWQDARVYSCSQIVAGVAGVVLAHAMFGVPLLQLSEHARGGPAQALSEVVATFGLLLVIRSCARSRPEAVPVAVGLYITGAYWFIASTSFANPAITIARSLTNTFAGIRPADVPMFVVAQLAGAVAATVVSGWLLTSVHMES